MENDRVFNDLWGKNNMPVVLNNPYSEKEQVSAVIPVGALGEGISIGASGELQPDSSSTVQFHVEKACC